MFYPHEYSNRDIDAQIMLGYLEAGRRFTSEQVEANLAKWKEAVRDCIRNYSNSAYAERQHGFWLMLASHRNTHTDPVDDCTHWIH